MLDALRGNPPKEIGGLLVTKFEDYRDESGRFGPFKGDTDKAARNFLLFQLNPSQEGGIGAKVCLRPSGTEPKAKAYIEVRSEPRSPGTPDAIWQQTCQAVDTRVQQVASDFLRLALATVGETPAPGADKLTR